MLDAIDDSEIPSFVEAPMLCQPREHTAGKHGGYIDPTAVHDDPRHENHKGSIEFSEAHLDYLNNLQEVPYRINKQILDVLEALSAQKPQANREVGKFIPPPCYKTFFTVVIPARWDVADAFGDITEEKYNALRKEAIEAKGLEEQDFRRVSRRSAQLHIKEMMRLARMDRDRERIYFPTFSDFRGRTYYRVQPLNPQAIDPAKALLEWADGYTPETEEDEVKRKLWIIYEMAGNLGYDKLSWDERAKRTLVNIDDIVACATNPIGTDFWKKADKPFLFLAAAFEYHRLYIQQDPDRCSHLRVSVDATCSGQQCHAGWLRNLQTAKMVNLVDTDAPADVYMSVFDAGIARIKGPIDGIETGKLEEMKTTDVDRRQAMRKGPKAQVMVAQYSAGADRQMEDFRGAFKMPWLAGDETDPKVVKKLTTLDSKETGAVFKELFLPGLDDTLPALKSFIQFTQGVAKATLTDPHPDNPEKWTVKKGDDGKWVNTVRYRTPAGSTVSQHYRESRNRSIALDHLGSTQVRHTVEKEMKDYPRVDKHHTSIAANFTHAGDGSILILGPGELLKEDIPLSSTHDSVAGRPGPEMDRIVESLKVGLKQVVTSDVLEQFVTINGLSLEDHPIPRESEDSENYWDPDLLDDADYAFC